MKKTKGEILLESGTNEIEIMEFMIYGELYGINVAKVTEIMMSDKVKPIPHSHPVVEGIFKPRETVLTVIDLPKYLTGRESEKDEKDLFIVTNFNKMFATFRVHSVVGISRISWNDIQKPDKTISGGEEGVATGIAQTDGVLVTILDFEKIVSEIAPETGIRIEEIEKMGKRNKSKKEKCRVRSDQSRHNSDHHIACRRTACRTRDQAVQPFFDGYSHHKPSDKKHKRACCLSHCL